MSGDCATSNLTIPARLPYDELAGAYAAALARLCGLPEEQSQQLAQALGLTIQELLRLAFGPQGAGTLSLTGERLPAALQITIQEQGLPLDPSELASLQDDSQVCPVIHLGNHLACVRDVWDEASFHNLGRAGAEVRLVKYLPASTPELKLASCTEPSGPMAAGPPPGQRVSLEVRPFAPTDALDVVRLLYRTYGYSYPFENLYYPERLVALNAGGTIRSMVAVTSGGELVGHLAMFFAPDRPELVELGTAVVAPDFRGHGCLHLLTEYAVAEAGRSRVAALFGRPVTNHVYSQKVVADLGFVPCGLLVGFGPAFLSFKEIHDTLSQRESMLLIYRGLQPVEAGKIFPPAQHRDFIGRLYAGLGMRPEMAAPEGGAGSASSPTGQLDIRTFPDGGIALIKVKAIGPDTLPEIRSHVRHLCQARFEAIQLELDLRQPEVYHLAPQCESLGFFFGGILPVSQGPQSLLLQYLNNVPLDYDKILLHGPLAQEILAYVKAADPNRL